MITEEDITKQEETIVSNNQKVLNRIKESRRLEKEDIENIDFENLLPTEFETIRKNLRIKERVSFSDKYWELHFEDVGEEYCRKIHALAVTYGTVYANALKRYYFLNHLSDTAFKIFLYMCYYFERNLPFYVATEEIAKNITYDRKSSLIKRAREHLIKKEKMDILTVKKMPKEKLVETFLSVLPKKDAAKERTRLKTLSAETVRLNLIEMYQYGMFSRKITSGRYHYLPSEKAYEVIVSGYHSMIQSKEAQRKMHSFDKKAVFSRGIKPYKILSSDVDRYVGEAINLMHQNDCGEVYDTPYSENIYPSDGSISMPAHWVNDFLIPDEYIETSDRFKDQVLLEKNHNFFLDSVKRGCPVHEYDWNRRKEMPGATFNPYIYNKGTDVLSKTLTYIQNRKARKEMLSNLSVEYKGNTIAKKIRIAISKKYQIKALIKEEEFDLKRRHKYQKDDYEKILSFIGFKNNLMPNNMVLKVREARKLRYRKRVEEKKIIMFKDKNKVIFFDSVKDRNKHIRLIKETESMIKFEAMQKEGNDTTSKPKISIECVPGKIQFVDDVTMLRATSNVLETSRPSQKRTKELLAAKSENEADGITIEKVAAEAPTSRCSVEKPAGLSIPLYFFSSQSCTEDEAVDGIVYFDEYDMPCLQEESYNLAATEGYSFGQTSYDQAEDECFPSYSLSQYEGQCSNIWETKAKQVTEVATATLSQSEAEWQDASDGKVEGFEQSHSQTRAQAETKSCAEVVYNPEASFSIICLDNQITQDVPLESDFQNQNLQAYENGMPDIVDVPKKYQISSDCVSRKGTTEGKDKNKKYYIYNDRLYTPKSGGTSKEKTEEKKEGVKMQNEFLNKNRAENPYICTKDYIEYYYYYVNIISMAMAKMFNVEHHSIDQKMFRIARTYMVSAGVFDSLCYYCSHQFKDLGVDDAIEAIEKWLKAGTLPPDLSMDKNARFAPKRTTTYQIHHISGEKGVELLKDHEVHYNIGKEWIGNDKTKLMRKLLDPEFITIRKFFGQNLFSHENAANKKIIMSAVYYIIGKELVTKSGKKENNYGDGKFAGRQNSNPKENRRGDWSGVVGA